MGALEAPQDRHRQERRMGTSRAEQTDRDHGGAGNSGSHGGAGSSEGHGGAGSSGDHGGAGSSGGHGRWSLGPLASTPLGPAPTAGTLLPPPPNFHGEVRGYQEPSRAKQTGQYKTRQDSPPGPDRQDRTSHNDRKALQGQTDNTGHPTTTGKPSRARQTRHPTGTRSPPGLARRLRLPLGMTRIQGPSQGPSVTASTSATRGQAARMASMATTRGAACPRRVSMDKTRHDMVD